MPVADEDFIALFEQHGPAETARRLGSDLRATYARRKRLEGKIGRQITGPEKTNRATRQGVAHPGRLEFDVKDGVVLVGSDCHYWNIEPSTAHRAFVKFCKELSPKIVVMNGDVLDGASISRHPPINWEKQPSLIQEIEACQERLGEIEKVAEKAKRVWCLGNHDGRFEVRLATVAPEYARINGVHLKDHFPLWQAAWSCWVNDDVVIKHRARSGIHAVHNNTMWAGKTMVTGHLHSLKISPMTDYRGTRFGIDCGTMADPWGPQFEYLEDGFRNWRSGFAVLTFVKSRLVWPEIVHVVGEDEVEFRGKVIRV
jgi:hypothetical protein